jgi:DNA helicase-2/ATP-dependent DNA helicase PcrA
MYVAITRAKKRLFLSRPKMKLNYESGRTEYAVESRFLNEIFGNIKQTNVAQNSAVSRSNIYNTGFDSYMSKRERSEELSQNMSSHINVVNVSGTTQPQTNQNKVSPSDYSKYKTGVKVKHPHFGEGTVTLGVTDFASAFVTIKFDSVGIKTLSLKYANLEIID